MAHTHQRTIHFADTDAAGVVYFANYLSFCHEAYEESLAAAGIDLKTFFGDNGIVIPIAKSTADYLRPLVCGDKIAITVKPAAVASDTFTIDYEITRLAGNGAGGKPAPAKLAAVAQTRHVCIRADTRARAELPPALAAWVRTG